MARRIVRWRHELHRPKSRRDAVVWIDVAALDAAWLLDGSYYLGVGAPTSRHRYVKFAAWFGSTRRWVGYPSVDPAGDAVAFTDGRHRFAWMRDHGVSALPIACEQGAADEMRRRFGTTARSSVLAAPAALAALEP